MQVPIRVKVCVNLCKVKGNVNLHKVIFFFIQYLSGFKMYEYYGIMSKNVNYFVCCEAGLTSAVKLYIWLGLSKKPYK